VPDGVRSILEKVQKNAAYNAPVSSLVRFLLAYALGAAVGAGTLGVEWLLLGHRRSVEGLLGYCLLGGLIGGVSRLLLGLVLPARPARAGVFLTLAAFGSLVALYVINVHVLAGGHYLAPRSLLLDSLVLIGTLVAAIGLSRSSRVRAARLRRLGGVAVLGASLLATNDAGLWMLSPTQPEAAPGKGEGPNLC
jgi:hypothetical protein